MMGWGETFPLPKERVSTTHNHRGRRGEERVSRVDGRRRGRKEEEGSEGETGRGKEGKGGAGLGGNPTTQTLFLPFSLPRRMSMKCKNLYNDPCSRITITLADATLLYSGKLLGQWFFSNHITKMSKLPESKMSKLSGSNGNVYAPHSTNYKSNISNVLLRHFPTSKKKTGKGLP